MNRTLSINAKRKLIKYAAIFSAFLLLADFIYSKINNISYANREECILNRLLPRPGFLFVEYVLELAMLVFLGIFIATLLESYFSRFKKFYPSNMSTAFVYASILPVCACSVIPLIQSLQGKLSFRNIITFVVSAPLLSPYIIVLSLSIIGMKYTLIRIIASFLLAASTGIVLEFFYNRLNIKHNMLSGPVLFPGNVCGSAADCGEIISQSASCKSCASSTTGGCSAQESDIFLKTYTIFKEVLPYIAIAGAAGIALEFVPLNRLLLDWDIDNSFTSVVVATLIGVPVYFCSGTEVLFLRPLMHTTGFSMGTAIAFTLSSTSICLTSAIMLLKFMGKGLTAILIAHIFIVSIIIGYIMNLYHIG